MRQWIGYTKRREICLCKDVETIDEFNRHASGNSHSLKSTPTCCWYVNSSNPPLWYLRDPQSLKSLMLLINFGYWPSVNCPCVLLSTQCTKLTVMPSEHLQGNINWSCISTSAKGPHKTDHLMRPQKTIFSELHGQIDAYHLVTEATHYQLWIVHNDGGMQTWKTEKGVCGDGEKAHFHELSWGYLLLWY